MTAVALGGFLCALLIVLLASLCLSDRLLRHQYHVHRDAWERDGRPVGYLFRPPEVGWFHFNFAAQRGSLSWLFYTPTWIRGDSAAKSLLSRLRWCVLIWNVGIILFFVFLFAHLSGTLNV